MATLILLVCLYLPLRGVIERYVATPLLLHGRPVIARGAWFKQAVRTGDWVAYTVAGDGAHIEHDFGTSALDVGQIIASPGDRVEFSGDTLRVNGEVQPTIPLLQTTRTLVLPERCWLVRPNVQASMNHQTMAVGEAQANALLSNAVVQENRLVGPVFQNWFGRKPSLP